MLVLMDVTVIMATCKSSMFEKLTLLQNYCVEYGMQVYQSKTQFFCCIWWCKRLRGAGGR